MKSSSVKWRTLLCPGIQCPAAPRGLQGQVAEFFPSCHQWQAATYRKWFSSSYTRRISGETGEKILGEHQNDHENVAAVFTFDLKCTEDQKAAGILSLDCPTLSGPRRRSQPTGLRAKGKCFVHFYSFCLKHGIILWALASVIYPTEDPHTQAIPPEGSASRFFARLKRLSFDWSANKHIHTVYIYIYSELYNIYIYRTIIYIYV